MSETTKYSDLCSTCNHAPTCVQIKNIKRPVLFCEEFDDYVKPVHEKVREAVSELKEDYDKTMGLCCNCSNRDICTISKPNGGIWHCEEYC